MHRAATDDLNRMHGIDGAIRFSWSALGGPVANLSHEGATATLALKGAQVLSYVPAGGSDVFWLSPAARLDDTAPVRGGIPVCWPWFGPHPTDPGQPSHGTVRTASWDVDGTSADAGGTRIALARKPGSNDLRVTARLQVELCQGHLGVTLETANNGDRAFTLTQALHSYFAISDIAEIAIDGFDGASYLDKLTGQTLRQSGAITFDAETDRIYANPAQRPSLIRDAHRAIAVAHGGQSLSAVVWNPWAGKAARLGDVPGETWRDFVCVETTSAGDDILTVPPGERRSITVRIEAGPPMR